MGLPKNVQLDKDNIWYLDDKDIKKTLVSIENKRYDYIPRSEFYIIDGIDDYLIKIGDPLVFFQSTRIKKMLFGFYQIEKNLPNIDLPLAYYQKDGKAKGLIVPFYSDSISVKKMFRLSDNSIQKYYHHDENEERNLLLLYYEILCRLWEMYDAGMVYLDVHEGNFIVYQNGIKVIDFEPSYVNFKPNNRNYTKIIEKYCYLINYISYKTENRHLMIFPKQGFSDVAKDIKRLYKKI